LLTCSRRLEFDYGHRLLKHESKCAHAHGHRGVVEIECSASELDSVGRIIDFSAVKELVGGWIDANWDHAFIYFDEDERMAAFLETGEQRRYSLAAEPTAENLVRHLGVVASGLLAGRGISVVRVRLYETPNCFAEWRP
jgi:6-pyruvoyltetrahydropterin/6-carboxytetrahydropterin synthase